MKIIVFNWRDIKNPNRGGAEVFTHEVFKRLAKQHEITLLTSEFDGCKKEENIDGIRVIRRGKGHLVYIRAKKYYQKHLAKEKFDIVVDEINTRPFLTPKFVKNGEQIIAIFHQLAEEYWNYETFFPVSFVGRYVLEKRWLRLYKNLPTITVSKSSEQDLKNLGFKNIFIVDSGLTIKPLKSVPPKSKDPSVIYIGRLKKAKRPDLLVKAFKIVNEKVPTSELWIIGDGYLLTKMKKMKVPGVKFFGATSEKEKFALLSGAWILVNPSVREGWGLNAIEANSQGTPVIAYDVPGLRDSVRDGRTGLLVKQNNSKEALAEEILKLLTDSKLRAKLSKEGLKFSQRFNWDLTGKQVSKIINKLTI
jgi:glycosyltransferase involved in cell wall biosynthesis